MLWLTTFLWGCGEVAVQPASAPVGPYWQKRSPGELQVALRQACERARTRSAPVLLTFSAPWCSDCQVLRRMAEEPVLAEELGHWEKVVIDVGRFDRHQGLLEHFRIGSIAHQVALRPTDCAVDVTKWPVLAAGTFEVSSNPQGPRSAEDVAAWLAAAR
jgi:thiol-disulfide isomerase/thioredoxin